MWNYFCVCFFSFFFKGQHYHNLLTSRITAQSSCILWTTLCIIWPKPTCRTILYQFFFNFFFCFCFCCFFFVIVFFFHVCLVIMIRCKKIHLLNEVQNQSRMVKQNRKGTKNTQNISVNLVKHNREASTLGLMY